MTNEELEQEVKRLEEQITNLRIKLLESKADKKPYEVEVPNNINCYFTKAHDGREYLLLKYDKEKRCDIYKRGLAFKNSEDLKKFEKERILLFKMHKWAEEHNGGWTPNWNDLDEEKCTVMYDNADEKLDIYETYFYRDFTKLPVFKSEEIAEKFIEEFGEEIKEVLC